jgi:hypothetical protein
MPPSKAPQLVAPVREHALQCWLSGELTSRRKVAAALGMLKTTKDGSESVSTCLRNYLHRLKGEGVVLRVGGDDPDGPAEKLGFRIAGFNYAGRPLAEQSLRDALAPLLSDPGVKQANKQLLKEGLRLLLPSLTGVDLRGTKTDEMVLVAASRIKPDAVSGLQQLALDLDHPKRNEFGRMIRHLMRYAHERNLIALVLPAKTKQDAWTSWIDAHLPIATKGPTSAQRDRQRRACRRLREQLIAMRPASMPATPDDVTPAMANAALERLVTVHGDWRNYPIYRRDLLDLGIEGLGPYRSVARIGIDLVRKYDGVHASPWFYLYDSRAAERGKKFEPWASLIAAVQEHGLPASMLDFVGWVRDYSSLSDSQLSKVRDPLTGLRRFPKIRPAVRQVQYSAQMHRIQVFRAWLGIAVHILKIPPAECTPERIFGVEFDEIALAMRQEWERRAEASKERAVHGLPAVGGVRHAASAGLHDTIVLAGVIALLGYDKSRHERGLGLSGRKVAPSGRDAGVDMNGLRQADMQTVGEDRLAAAYAFGQALAKQLLGARGGRHVTTNKSREVVYADVPTMDLIPDAVDAIAARLAAKQKDDELPFDALRVFLAAIVASGAVRIEECAHLRQDVHFAAECRRAMVFSLRSVDRKGGYCNHVVPLTEELTPRWFVSYVMDVARPKVLARWTAVGHAPHEFIFMDRNGRPFGDPFESADGKARNKRLICTRKTKLEGMFLDFRISAMLAAKNEITLAHGNNTPHADRGRVGNICRNTAGIGAARGGQLLGHVGSTTVDRSYSIACGEAHRAILREVLQTRDWYARRHDVSRQALEKTDVDTESSLLRQYERGEISAKTLADAMLELRGEKGPRLKIA